MEFRKNDVVTVEIEDIGSEGEGIGKVEGFALFVKDAVVGDTVEARIVKCKKNYAYARLERVIKPSPFRVKPRCEFHRQCGGCQLQALSYEKQLVFKQEKIRRNLIHIGNFAPEDVDRCMEPMIGMENPFRYRNKALYPVGMDKAGNVITGFYAGRTHDIIANTGCWLGVEENQEILECILRYMQRNKVSAYNESTGTGIVRHILIRKGFVSKEIMVCVVINPDSQKDTVSKCQADRFRVDQSGSGKIQSGQCPYSQSEVGQLHISQLQSSKEEVGGCQFDQFQHKQFRLGKYLPEQERLLSELTKINGMTSVSVSVNPQRSNLIMGKEIYTIWGSNTISDTIRVRDMKQPGYPFTGEELTFHISPLSFYQVNPVQTEKLYSLALEFAGLTGQETVWDLYCGIGTMSLFLAKSAKMVYGVEVVPQAVEDARENAIRNGISNAEFLVGKAEEVLPDFYSGNGKIEQQGSNGGVTGSVEMTSPDVIVVDPPRKGCDEACLVVMLQMRPKRIVYVSCDSATLARDLKVLCDGGYRIERIRGVDQFGMTVHVETVVLMSWVEK